MMQFEKEHLLVEPVMRYLRGRGFRRLALEVPFFDHRIDLYGYSVGGNVSVAVELKLSKWQLALKQALLYQLCADRAFIAMPSDAIGRIDVKLLAQHGVGLIEIRSPRSCKERLAPGPPHFVLPQYRSEFMSRLLEEA